MALTTLYHGDLYDTRPVPSYWEATAKPPQAGFDPLKGDETCDVAIIGAGFCGLSTAYHLARDHERDVRVLDAGHIGWGASGRNAGFVCYPAGKLGLKGMVARYGQEATRAFIQSQLDAVDVVESFIRDEAIDVSRQGQGFFDVVHHPAAFADIKAYGDAMRETFGVETRVYSKEEFSEIGHKGVEQFGALHMVKGFGLHPLKYHAGLARATAAKGAKLHGHSFVERWERDGAAHRLVTANGSLKARQVIVATNGYLREGLNNAFDGRLLPMLSNMVVTRPLSDEELEATGFINQSPMFDSRWLLNYYRLLPDKRLIFGARGDLSGDPKSAERMKQHIIQRLGAVFPALKGIQIDYYWRGFICATRSAMPAMGRLPDDPTIFFAYGCHGTGVNTMSWAGKQLARLAAGANRDEDVIPDAIRGLSPRFGFPALRKLYLRAAYLYYGMKDK